MGVCRVAGTGGRSMGNHHLPIPIKIALALLLAAKLGLRPALAAGDKGSLPDILIQAEEKQVIQRNKPPLGLQVKEEAPSQSLLQTDDEVRLKMPTEVTRLTRFVTNTWVSPHTALPTSNYIVLAGKGE